MQRTDIKKCEKSVSEQVSTLQEFINTNISELEQSFARTRQSELALPGLIGPNELYPTMAAFASFVATEALPKMERSISTEIQATRDDLTDQIASLEYKIRNIVTTAPS